MNDTIMERDTRHRNDDAKETEIETGIERETVIETGKQRDLRKQKKPDYFTDIFYLSFFLSSCNHSSWLPRRITFYTSLVTHVSLAFHQSSRTVRGYFQPSLFDTPSVTLATLSLLLLLFLPQASQSSPILQLSRSHFNYPTPFNLSSPLILSTSPIIRKPPSKYASPSNHLNLFQLPHFSIYPFLIHIHSPSFPFRQFIRVGCKREKEMKSMNETINQRGQEGREKGRLEENEEKIDKTETTI